MAYAAPAGGILCLELLKSTFEGHLRHSDITRSTIIQQLSLLVGFLDWVSPGAPNADLCCSCKTVIERVLDHTLNAGAHASSSTVPALEWEDFAAASFGDYFNFDLLDTFDWMRPEVGVGH
jgi:hypothetical protein